MTPTIAAPRALAAEVVADLAALTPGRRAQWDALAVAAGRPFAAPGWLVPWWEHVRPPGAQLRLVVVTAEDGGVVGVGPFYVTGRGRLSTWRPLGAGLCDRVEPLAAAGRGPEVAAALAGAMAGAGADIVTLEGMPPGSPWPALLRDAWPGTRRPWLGRRPVVAALAIDLRGQTFDAWFMNKTSHFRQRLRRSRREFAGRGGVVRAADAQTVEQDLQDFAALHRSRWASRAADNVITPQVEQMLQAVGRALPAGDRLRVVALELDGQTIASSLLLAAGSELAYWRNCFSPEFAALSPSRISILTVIERAFASGADRLDLGAGIFDYKLRFADAEEVLDWYWLVPPGRRAPLARAAVRARWAAGD
ncbi:MAG TPA: GNAT family N-acetyltransferase, partial [Solirubrobacteraceae bacterium]